jgi:hypothetical protein
MQPSTSGAVNFYSAGDVTRNHRIGSATQKTVLPSIYIIFTITSFETFGFQDGFVLVGSVAGQRYWSTLLPADVNNITSGVWTPDDQHVYLGTSQVIRNPQVPLLTPGLPDGRYIFIPCFNRQA